LPIEGEMKLIVRFGDVYNSDNEELLILPLGIWNRYCAVYIRDDCTFSTSTSSSRIEDGSLKLKHLQTEWVNTKEHTEVEDKEEENKERKKEEYWPALGQIKATING
jgi:hypothetical protein